MRSNLLAVAGLALLVLAGSIALHRVARAQSLVPVSSAGTPEYSLVPSGPEGRWSDDEIRRYRDEDDVD